MPCPRGRLLPYDMEMSLDTILVQCGLHSSNGLGFFLAITTQSSIAGDTGQVGGVPW